MRHFCAGGRSGLPVFTLRVGAPVATGLVFASLCGSVHLPRHVPLGEGCSRSALPPWGWEAAGTDPGEPAFSQTLVTQSAPQGRGAGPPQPGHGHGHSLGMKAAQTSTPDPAEGPLCPPSGPAPAGSADAAADTPVPGLPAQARGPSPRTLPTVLGGSPGPLGRTRGHWAAAWHRSWPTVSPHLPAM